MMPRTLFLFVIICLVGCGKQETQPREASVPERIISLAPDITETVHALGLGDKLMGATTYCTYPDAAKTVPRVGGFGQFNFEAIVTLKPDLVILHEGYENEKSRLDGLGIRYLATKTRSVADITESIRKVGMACGAEAEVEKRIGEINARIAGYRKTSGDAPRVLITFGGDASSIDQIHAFGTECLHNELLEIAGGKNVVEGHLPFSTLSKEAAIRLNPDIIIQLAPGTEAPADPTKAWQGMAGINAVKNHRIHVLTGDHTCIPGPRFIQTLDDFAEIIRQND